MEKNNRRLKIACYSMNISMAVISNISPLLFLTFKSLYNISYSLLGLLVLINYLTQLAIDLIFSFFPNKFNISYVIKVTPILTMLGLLIYSISPFFIKENIYIFLVIGTIIFSASSGLAEVLLSPVIAAITNNDEREMSKLHSLYAWGVVGVIIIGTLYLFVFGSKNWQYLVIFYTLIPLFSFIMYSKETIPNLVLEKSSKDSFKFLKSKTLWLCILAIFLGGAAECSMAQWSSSYLEKALNIPKVYGDIFGVALFGLMMGLGRSWYAKRGKNIEKILFISVIGSTICYLLTTLISNPVIVIMALALNGLFVALLWPGSLIISNKKIPTGGLFIYAMMAAGGDFGASVGPQLIGIITDIVLESNNAITIANSLNMDVEQLAMKCGMFIGMIFPLIAIFVFLKFYKDEKNKSIKQ